MWKDVHMCCKENFKNHRIVSILCVFIFCIKMRKLTIYLLEYIYIIASGRIHMKPGTGVPHVECQAN